MTRFGNLGSDQLQVILLGPGFGESVLVRAPGDPPGWMVVDSLQTDRRGAARCAVLEVLEEFDVEPDLVLLTHPHADHAGGMAAVVERFSERAAFGVLQIDVSTVSSSRVREAAKGVETAAALRAIRLLGPERRWDLGAGPRPLGEGMVTVLHPSATRLAELLQMSSIGPNRFSSALLVEWRDRSVLLGADLERPEWAPLVDAGRLRTCDPVKVPHHGSAGAFDKVWAGDKALDASNAGRRMLIAPFNMNPKLPDIDADDALPALLAEVNEVHLTSLPFRTEPVVTGASTLTQLRSARDAAVLLRPALPAALGTMGPLQTEPSDQDAWVLAEVGESCVVRGGAEHVALTQRTADGGGG